jgi:hypothetical protein
MAFAQTAPIDLAFLFAGDTLMYLEFIVIVRLTAGKEYLQHALRIAAQLASFTIGVARAAIRQPVSRINRLRERHSAVRAAKPLRGSDRSDEGRGFATSWGVLAAA